MMKPRQRGAKHREEKIPLVAGAKSLISMQFYNHISHQTGLELMCMFVFIGLLHYNTPPGCGLTFSSTPEDLLKLHSPLKTSIKYGFTPEELGHTPEEFCEK